MNRDRCCGIYFVVDQSQRSHRYWLPLESLSAEAKIFHISSRIILRQTFSNPKSIAISSGTYIFPLYAGVAIVGFSCNIGERTIKGEIRENQMDMADTEIKRTGSKPGPDFWSTEIRDIPSRCKVEVEITLVCQLELKHKSQCIRFELPSKVSPKPAPAYQITSRSGHGGMHSGNKGRGLQLTVEVTMATPIKSLHSPSHSIKVQIGTHTRNRSLFDIQDIESLGGFEGDACRGFATLGQKDAALDKDFILDIISEGMDTGQPHAILETHPSLPNSRALLLSLNPQYEMPRIKPEIVLIVDKSGIMLNRIPQLEQALKVFLKSFPVGAKFNMCWFDRDYRFLWPKGSRPYNQRNLDTAFRFVESFYADYKCEKDLLPPLKKVLKVRRHDRPTEKEIIILTDGSFKPADFKSVCELVSNKCQSGRVRVFTIGSGVVRPQEVQQLKTLARIGKGGAQTDGYEDNLVPELVKMLKAALSAHFQDCHLEFPDSTLVTDTTQLTENEEIFDSVERLEEIHSEMKSDQEESDTDTQTRSPNSLPSATADESSLIRLQTPHQISPDVILGTINIYTILSSSSATPGSVTVKRTTTLGERSDMKVLVKDVGMGTTVHQLAARKYIQELEERYRDLMAGKLGIASKDRRKLISWISKEGVQVGKAFDVEGKWTSLVSVENASEMEHQGLVVNQTEEDENIVNHDFGKASLGSMQNLYQLYAISSSETPYREEKSIFRYFGLIPKCFREVFVFIGFLICCCTASDVIRAEEEEQLLPNTSVHSQSQRSRVQELDSNTTGSSPLQGPDASESSPAQGVDVDTPESSPVQGVDDDTLESASDSESESCCGENESMDFSDDEKSFYALMQLQAFDGSFPPVSEGWTQKIIHELNFDKWIRQTEERMALLQSSNIRDQERLVASAIAVTIFQRDLKHLESGWEMMVEKTDAWAVEKAGETAWNDLKTWVGQQMHITKIENHIHCPWSTTKKGRKHSDHEEEAPNDGSGPLQFAEPSDPQA